MKFFHLSDLHIGLKLIERDLLEDQEYIFEQIIRLAKQNEIPVLFFNREPVWEDLTQWEDLYYVGCDAEQSGIMQGETAAE